MQRNFEPMRKQVEAWQRSELTDVTAKVVIYEAFIEGKLEAPKYLARSVHDLYFEPKYEEFRLRTTWRALECVYIRIQGIGCRPTIQSYGQTGRIPTSPILTIVLACGARAPASLFPSTDADAVAK
jgi:hypothetical protein